MGTGTLWKCHEFRKNVRKARKKSGMIKRIGITKTKRRIGKEEVQRR
jgi:hypothetical protein